MYLCGSIFTERARDLNTVLLYISQILLHINHYLVFALSLRRFAHVAK